MNLPKNELMLSHWSEQFVSNVSMSKQLNETEKENHDDPLTWLFSAQVKVSSPRVEPAIPAGSIGNSSDPLRHLLKIAVTASIWPRRLV